MNYFVAPNGKLYFELKSFYKLCAEISGVSVSELWCDAYQINFDSGIDCLFPADFNCPFLVIEHLEKKDEFINKGGGFRLNLKAEF